MLWKVNVIWLNGIVPVIENFEFYTPEDAAAKVAQLKTEHAVIVYITASRADHFVVGFESINLP